MRQLGIEIRRGRRAARHLTLVASLAVAWLAAVEGCGGGSTTTTTSGPGGAGGATSSSSSTTTSTTTSSTTTTTTTTTTSSTTGTGGTGGAAPTSCTTAAKGPTRGSAIALSPDDKRIVTVNRDAGSVTVMSVDYSDGQPKMTEVAEIMVGNEPWQVALDGCGTTAYVVLRKDQKVVQITGVDTASPALGKSVSVGSEPTGLALTPNNTRLYVSNWVDGTLSVVDPASMTVTSTVDLNPVIAATGFLGPDVKAAPRPALAHPRGIAVTNGGGSDDTVETVYVTEWFAVRTNPEASPPTPQTPTVALEADVNWKGLLYAVNVGTGAASTIDLPPVLNTGFNDSRGLTGNVTGCFPNQVASVSLDGNGFAYVTSTCASPAGPTGVFQKGACGEDAQCTAAVGSTANGAAGSCVNGTACKGSCLVDSDCGFGSASGACAVATGVCAPDVNNAKTTTHPGLTIVNIAAATPTATTTNLDATFTSTSLLTSGVASTRMPLLPMDMDFKGGGFGYVAAEGADALFRVTIANGVITKAGATSSNANMGNFIDLHTATSETLRLPIGVVTSKDQAFAFVADDGTRDVTAIDLNAQAVAQGTAANDFRVTSSSPLPAAGTAAANVLNGRRFFVTGLGRWSLKGAAWGSCEACHVDGLTDNVTWYFARGPRQTTSLDGTFNKNDPTDQRILNWTAVNDEIADFEGNVRGISGGVGAIVNASATCTVANQSACGSGVCDPITLLCTPANADRIIVAAESPPQQGLQGSSADAASPTGASAHPHSANTNWANITSYVQQIRSPRGVSAGAPNAPAATDIAAGLATFTGSGNCIGCHSGPKWTYSKVFYTPGDTPNDAFGSTATTSLSTTSWNKPVAGFPTSLFPSAVATGKTDMRSGAPPGFEQLQCVLRPVGTIKANGAVPTGVSPAAVNVIELRQDEVTGGQGAGGVNANDFTTGFNVPSLLGTQVGAPFFHAGNARSLEEVFTGGGTLSTSIFAQHHASAIAQVFSPTATDVKQLVAFLLSLDGSTTPIAIPVAGDKGGDLCFYP